MGAGWIRIITGGASALLIIGGVGAMDVADGGALESVHVAAATALAGTYVGLAPTRMVDTRTGSGSADSGNALGPGATINVEVTGLAGVPKSGVGAVVLNVTVVGPTESSFLTVFPQGATQPVVSSLSFTAGETLANLVTVPVGAQGGVSIYNHTGRSDVVVDLEGFYTTSVQPTGLYNPVDPVRVFGSLQAGGIIGNGVSQSVTVAGGATGVPADASAVVVNATVGKSTRPGFVTVYPAPNGGMPAPPRAANVNFNSGQVIGNRVVVTVGAGGEIEVYNHAGTVNVDVDLYGYFTGSAGELGSAFSPLSPTRFTDTRVGINGSVLGADDSETFTFTSEGIPSNATALATNVTGLAGVAAGYLSIYPLNYSIPPPVGDVAIAADSIDQNFALMPLSSGSVKIFNSSAAPVNIVIDAFGYFAPPPPAVHIAASSTRLPADGMSTSAMTVSVTTGSGVAFDDPVSLTTTPSVTGSCGIASATGSTNPSGQVTSIYTASTTTGTCTITATEGNGGITGTVTITQT